MIEELDLTTNFNHFTVAYPTSYFNTDEIWTIHILTIQNLLFQNLNCPRLAFNRSIYSGCDGPYTRLTYECNGYQAFGSIPGRPNRIMKRHKSNGRWICQRADGECGTSFFWKSDADFKELPDGLIHTAQGVHGFCC